jgi:pimeloyl-ACP methyl ester carboxylesterase
VRYLHETGATEVSVVGASFGGWASAGAAKQMDPGSIDRLVLLAAPPTEDPELMQGAKLFIVARDDPSYGGGKRLVDIRDQYERATGPKELVVLDGAAHAQFIFETDQGERLMQEILRFLSQPIG